MLLEKQAESLLKAVTDLVTTVTALIKGADSASTAAIDADPVTDKKTTKKELVEIKKSAKIKAGKVLKELGKEKLGDLLSDFGADKFSALKGEADVFNNFMEAADKMLTDAESAGDDLLGESDDAKEYTLEDVKTLLLKVNNTKALGRDITRQILADLGVQRLPELKKDKYAEAIEKIETVLKDAGE